MPLIPDEEDFDSRLPPWVYADGASVELPEAMLSEDAGPTQADPQGLEMEAPQPWRPEEQDGGQQPQAIPERQPSRHEVRQAASRETHRGRRDVTEFQRQFRKDTTEESRQFDRDLATPVEPTSGQQMGKVAQAWRPPIFDQFQEVKSMAGSEDEVPLSDSLTIARADPVAEMSSAMDLAEAASQNADVAGEQSRYLHNAMSRLRDTEIGFMTKNYV